MRNIFLEKSYTKCGRETIPRPFSKSQNREYFCVNILKFYIYFLIVCQVENYRKWLKLSCRPLAFTSHKAFLKSKKRSGASLPALFLVWLLKKICYVVMFHYLSKFQCLVYFTSWDIGQYVYCLLTML